MAEQWSAGHRDFYASSWVPEPAASPTDPNARWGQLTFSSFDSGGTAGGGWQVKQITGGLTPAEIDLLRSKVSTQFESRDGVPQFPSPAEIERLPRRMVYLPLPNTTAACWHTVPAGVDGSGRPGNVFAHVILDRQPDTLRPPLRPIMWWRSPDLLTPFGADQVVAAELVDDVPRPGPVSPAGVVEFLLDGTYWGRLSVLSALLDALYARWRGGPGVVLGTRSTDSAATWITAVSLLMSAQAARQWSFSTLERPATLSGALEVPDLVAMAREDLADLDPALNLVVIDEEEMVEVGMFGGPPHRTASGSRIAVSRFSELADLILADSDSAVRALERLEELTVGVDEPGLDAAWPLAMVVADRPDVYGQALTEAAEVLRAHSPQSLRAQPHSFRMAAAAVSSQLGNDAASIFPLLTPGGVGVFRSVMADVLERIYLDRVIDDVGWLSRPEGVPLPADFQPGAPDEDVLSRADRSLKQRGDELRAALALSSLDAVDATVTAVRLMDLLLRSDLVPETDSMADLAVQVGTVLVDPVSGPTVLRSLGPIDPRVRTQYLADEIIAWTNRTSGLLGSRLAPEVLAWVRPEPTGLGGPDGVEELIRRPRVSAFDAEFAAAVASGRIDVPPAVLRDWRYFAVLVGLAERDRGQLMAFDVVSTLTPPPGWPAFSARELLHLVEHHPKAIPLSTAYPALYSETWSADLEALMSTFDRELARVTVSLRSNDDVNRLERLITLRRVAHDPRRRVAAGAVAYDATPTDVINARAIITELSDVLAHDMPLAYDLVVPVVVAFAVAALKVDGQRFPIDTGLLQFVAQIATQPQAIDAVDRLREVFARVPDAGLLACLQSFRRQPEHPAGPVKEGSVADVLLTLGIGSDRTPLMETALHLWLKSMDDGAFAAMQARVHSEHHYTVTGGGLTSRDQDRQLQVMDRIEKEWWREMRGRSSWLSRSFSRRSRS